MVTVSGSGRGKLLFVFLHHKEHGGLCREEDGLKKPPFQPDFDILAQAQVLQNRLIYVRTYVLSSSFPSSFFSSLHPFLLLHIKTFFRGKWRQASYGKQWTRVIKSTMNQEEA